jgi:hypothetical protein
MPDLIAVKGRCDVLAARLAPDLYLQEALDVRMAMNPVVVTYIRQRVGFGSWNHPREF